MVPNEWKSYQLSELCAKPISYGIVQTGENIEDGIPCLRVVDLSTEKMNPNEMIKTSHEINQAYKKTILEDNEIVMALRGGVGLVRLIDANLVGANITRGLARISAKKGIIHPEYLLWELRSPRFRADLIRRVGGSALQEISLSELRKVNTLVPSSLNEQKKIAQILSTWDQAILATEKLLENSQQQKNALMQQVLTGKKRLLDENGERFHEKWSEVLLGNIAKITTGSSNRQDSTLSGKYAFFDRSEDIRTSDMYLFDCEAVIVPGEGQDFVPKYFVGKFDLHQRTYAIMEFPECDGKFLFYIIDYFRAYFLSQAVGSTVKSLRLPMFQKMKLVVPCLDEQKKIAKVLTIADQEIDTLQKKLDCLKQEKKALMQQLLTGKKRVKVVA
ncbi:hypothetical protein DSM16313_24670 [Acinetobacter seohaensis]|nr:hypothetical protein DSM16313_24670 [Acinetobacter seohaensis]